MDIQNFEHATIEFLVGIRSGKGVDTEGLHNILLALEVFKQRYDDDDVVPKRLCRLLVEISPSMLGSDGLYHDANLTSLYVAEQKIMDAVLCLLSS